MSLPDVDRPILVMSDVDGTLINPRGQVSDRQREAVDRLIAAGHYFGIATGRPHRWISAITDQVRVNAPCITSNGAALLDTQSWRILGSHELGVDVLHSVVDSARRALLPHGGLAVAVERVGAAGAGAANPQDLLSESTDDLAGGAYAVTADFLHNWEGPRVPVYEEDEVLSQPALKLLLRNDNLTAQQMYGLVAPVIDPQVAHVTYSMNAGLMEVSVPGVNKGIMLAELAQSLGIEQSQVIAFGDMPNDAEMLRWAGHGVAMGNAHEDIKKLADEVTASNEEDGEAAILERLLG